MSDNQLPGVTKSQYMMGSQCSLALWRQEFAPDLADPTSAFEADLRASGEEVQIFARNLFPTDTSRSIPPGLPTEEAIVETARHMGNPQVDVIYEATFIVDGNSFRVDILKRSRDGGWDVVEIKATKEIQKHHVEDASFQAHHLEEAGIQIDSVQILGLSPDYVYPGGDIDPHQLLRFADITEEYRESKPVIEANVKRRLDVLASQTPPAVEVGSHCNKPFTCPFHGACHDLLPVREDGVPLHISQLAYLREGTKKHLEFRERGITRIDEIPEDMLPEIAKSKYQARQYRGAKFNEIWANEEGLAQQLAVLEGGFHNWDIEWADFAIPRYARSAPYEHIFMQWSNSSVLPDGTYRWADYLYDGQSDPRRRFAESLLEVFEKDELPIVHFHTPEPKALEALAALYPDLEARLMAVQPRMIDLLRIMKDNIYLPRYGKSYSEKSVLPAHVANFDHSDLQIKDGGACSAWLKSLTNPSLNPEQIARIRENLRVYNKRDTDGSLALTLALSAPVRDLVAQQFPEIHDAVTGQWTLDGDLVRRFVSPPVRKRISTF